MLAERLTSRCSRRSHSAPAAERQIDGTREVQVRNNEQNDKGTILLVGKVYTKYCQILMAMIGMIVPIIVGVCIGKPQIGSFAAFGALALSSEENSNNWGACLKAMLFALIAGVLAFLIGSNLAENKTLSLLSLPVIIFIVALLGSISRSLARSTTLFLLFLIIATSINSTKVSAVIKTAFFLSGAVWTLVLTIVLWPFQKKRAETTAEENIQKYKVHQLLGRWRKS